jgi:hypothetical protein
MDNQIEVGLLVIISFEMLGILKHLPFKASEAHPEYFPAW